MTSHAVALTGGWRTVYTLGLAAAVVTASYASGGSSWLGPATGGAPERFAIPGILLALLVLGRLAWIWRRPEVLTWPTQTGLRTLAKIALIASLGSIAGLIVLLAAGLKIGTLEPDVGGAAAFAVGLFLLPFMGLAPAGLVTFEWARGVSARAGVPTADRPLLAIAAITGALLVITPAVSSALFPSSSLTRAQYDGVLPWLAFALGLAAPIIRGVRGGRFPASAVFAVTVATYVVGGWLMVFLWPDRAGQFFLGGSLLADGAAFALVIALVPAAGLRLLGGLRAGRSSSWAVRGLLAVPLSSAAAWLGLSATTRFMQPSPMLGYEAVLADEQLVAQTDHLRRRCAEAGTQIFRTATDVTQLEIRQPDEPERREAPLLDFWSSPHKWFPARGRENPYELVVFVKNGERKAWVVLPPNTHGDAHAPEKDEVHPRYVLKWNSLQTAEEEADGVIGNEMSIIDTQDDSVLARRVLFFNRTNELYGSFREACGTLGPRYLLDTYVTAWVRTILIPKQL